MGAQALLLEPGHTLGRYHLKARIARGGMAEVWLAEATGLSGFQKAVVIKTILPQLADDSSFVHMFTNEAKVAAALNHPNIVQIFDLGAIDGTYFIAMEYVHGRTLRQIQRALSELGRPMPAWFALHAAMAMCDAIDYAHDRCAKDGKPLGIVHRDLTPENVMISFDGVTKVLDFGIAKACPSTLITKTGTLKGKQPYTAPERIRAAQGLSAEADRRTDIYSIGVVLYELITGQLPFHDESELGLLTRIVNEPPRPPRQLATWVPEELERAILRALAKEPSARPPTAAALREELAAYLASSGSPTTTERNMARFLASLFPDRSEPADHPRGGALERTLAPAPLELPSQSTQALAIEGLRVGRPAEAAAVLLVDPDGVTRRFVEIALSKHGFSVEVARGATAALEILQSTVIDLMICETDLPDMSGLQFHRRLQKESRLKAIPFIFLTSDTRTSTKVMALRAGADDALPKPCDAGELATRVHALVERQRQRREALQRRSYLLAGEFQVLPFPDLVGMLEMGKRTGTLSIATPRALGRVVFDCGRVVHASFGSLGGAQAFYRLMEEGSGQFEFSAVERVAEPSTIDGSAAELILEGARRIDVRRRDHPEVAPDSVPSCPPPTAGAGAQRRIAGTSITPAMAAQFEVGLRDHFSLGELSLWTGEELAAWTLSPGGRDRFHVHLIADVAEGVASLLPLAAPPGEREVLAGLAQERKVLGLDFFMRSERLVDVVLIDIRDPCASEGSLLRSPSLAIVAPPGGDFQCLGIAARIGLDSLLERLRPAAVMGLGAEALDGGLRELASLRGPEARLRCAVGALGDGRSDLRSLLVDGLRLLVDSPPRERTEGA